MNEPEAAPPRVLQADRDRRISGRTVVFGMFGFAFLVIGALFGYWDLYTRPFRQLQVALAERFPGSQPQVIGGKHKSHQPGAVNTLRIVLRVSESPLADEARSEAKAEQVVELADKKQDLSLYQTVEVVLIHIVPEENSDNWKVARPLTEWRERIAKAGGNGSPPGTQTGDRGASAP